MSPSPIFRRPLPTAPDLTATQLTRLSECEREIKRLEDEIAVILGHSPTRERPIWGPCTRCGAIWQGLYPDRKPKCCARCHNASWDKPLVRLSVSHVRRKRKLQAAQPRPEIVKIPAPVIPSASVADAAPVLTRADIGMTPPPGYAGPTAWMRLDRESTPPLPGYGMTPPPDVRFAEDQGPPQPERTSQPTKEPAYEPPDNPEDAASAEAGLDHTGPRDDHREVLEEQHNDAPSSDAVGGGDSSGEVDPRGAVHVQHGAMAVGNQAPAQPSCCSRPQVIDGVCLHCGAGAPEPRVRAVD